MAKNRKKPVGKKKRIGSANAALVEKLELIIRELPPKSLSLGELRDRVGQDGLLLFAALLTLVFMVPVSIPGVSTIFGGCILIVGICRVFGLKLWLPKSWSRRPLPAVKIRNALNKGVTWLHRLQALLRPHRMAWMAQGRMQDFFNGWSLILGALLLMLPFGLVPFSNTLPGLAILLLAMGMLERDGLMILAGHVTNILTMVYFTVLVAGGGALFNRLLEYIKSL